MSQTSTVNQPPDPITIIGSRSPAGSYVLRIRVRESMTMAFGRFKKGKLIQVDASEYCYVGSALFASR